MKRIAVIGSRTFDDYNLLEANLDHFLKDLREEIVIVSGGAKGADTLAEKYALARGYKTMIFKPDYKNHPGNIAPLIRNKTIMENADLVVAFTNGSSGTENALGHARRLNLPIRIVSFTSSDAK